MRIRHAVVGSKAICSAGYVWPAIIRSDELPRRTTAYLTHDLLGPSVLVADSISFLVASLALAVRLFVSRDVGAGPDPTLLAIRMYAMFVPGCVGSIL